MGKISRRDIFRMGLMAGGAALSLKAFDGGTSGGSCGGGQIIEAFPTSPLILSPFNDPLPIPTPLAPVPLSQVAGWSNPPGPGIGQQDSDGGTHQIWPSQLGLPDPVVYQVKLQVRPHNFTSSMARALVDVKDANGNLIIPAGTVIGYDPVKDRERYVLSDSGIVVVARATRKTNWILA